ncbi:class I SAM-dependent methyltransferase [Crocosphaera sp. UHCC 0190]|uniref:class I SAM-dependent methyltransferase n=1 Tax=Crocosphaera sp. UHCC 0190 TaxID=3110246 RepID=UPI002B1FEECA|nr:class I SAM-dependent methyltransferase [Crocosphaera sp. UHCC 0190]MEA5509373.1 class I SAM-dependent methyltransferase [Crocosphaera sp. UHCC 0190]
METELMRIVRQKQRTIEKFVALSLLPRSIFRSIRTTSHFKQWHKVPMNYVRIIELPLTWYLLEPDQKHKILDISSPKLLSLFLSANNYNNLTISDISDYFVKDFEKYAKKFAISPEIAVFDAKSIPYPENTFDRVFSVSVLEHVPDTGDMEIVKDVARVLKPGGIFVITLPAYENYLEEWLKNTKISWPTVTNSQGESFFQRRYDETAIEKRFENLGLEIKDIIYIAEKPIKKPQINDQGLLLHNVYYLEDLSLSQSLNKIYKKFNNTLPFVPYISHRYCSQQYHYLTRDAHDTNIRQVGIKFQKFS